MTFHSTVFTILIGTFTLLASSVMASDKTQTTNHLHAHDHDHKTTLHHSGYVKPGAAIAMSHTYDGQTLIGEVENFSVTLTHIYDDGTLTLDLLSAADLNITTNINSPDIPLYSDSTFTFQLQVSSDTSGEFSLSLSTTYEGLDGQQARRVLSIPIKIESENTKKPEALRLQVSKLQNKETADLSSKPNSVIALPAQEVIR